MNAKALEIRDKATFIPALAVEMMPNNEGQRYLLRRAGYGLESGDRLIMLTRLDGGRAAYDPYYWGDRTWANAHHFIIKNWDNLEDGDVIDVEFILKETPTMKVSESMGYLT